MCTMTEEQPWDERQSHTVKPVNPEQDGCSASQLPSPWSLVIITVFCTWDLTSQGPSGGASRDPVRSAILHSLSPGDSSRLNSSLSGQAACIFSATELGFIAMNVYTPAGRSGVNAKGRLSQLLPFSRSKTYKHCSSLLFFKVC